MFAIDQKVAILCPPSLTSQPNISLHKPTPASDSSKTSTPPQEFDWDPQNFLKVTLITVVVLYYNVDWHSVEHP